MAKDLNQDPIVIVGCGPGSPDYLTPAARRAAEQADVLVGSQRLLDGLPGGRERIPVTGDTAGLLDRIDTLLAAGRGVTVLVSGDAGLFSLAGPIVQRFSRSRCAIVPGISSVQVAFARLALDWADARLVSAHGRPANVSAEELARSDKIAILAGTAEAIAWSAQMAAQLADSHAAFLCENLTLTDERVAELTPEKLGATDASSLAIVVLVQKTLLACCMGAMPATVVLSQACEASNGKDMAAKNAAMPPTQWAKSGTLYGIGVGPGDPQWLTVRAARLLATTRHVCVPRSPLASESVALDIAREFLRPDAIVHEIPFPMTADAAVLRQSWQQAARQVNQLLAAGDDVCFLTLGDAMLYSTYIYLVRELRAIQPDVAAVTVPGITAFSGAAALAGFPIGTGRQTVTIVPAGDDLADFGAALDRGGTVVLMKIGDRLERVLDELDQRSLLDRAVLVSRVGLADQRITTDLRTLRGGDAKTGYLSILLVDASKETE